MVNKGRGSVSNDQSRFIKTRSEVVDDGWGSHQGGGQEGGGHPADPAENDGSVKTELFVDKTKKLITENKSPDIPFDHSINPYKGCEHGCIYCFARPTHAYLDLSPGLDFETKIFRKSNPKEHLLVELSRPKYKCSVIAMGTNTDPYQPYERSQRVTREILETLLVHKHPVSIVTKSKLILRDIDILKELAEHNLISVNVSVTTLRNQLKTILEPRTASPAARLRTIAELRSAGVPTGAMIAPVIPFINDDEIESAVQAVAEAGAITARYILLRLPLEVAPLFTEWLETHYPDRANRVLNAIKQTRRGALYRSGWHTRMRGEGEIANLLHARFSKALRAAGLADREMPKLANDRFQPPARTPSKVRGKREDDQQMSLF